MAKMTWMGDRFMRDLGRASVRQLHQIGKEMEKTYHRILGKPAIRIGGKWIGSKPGEPPRKRTGWGQSSVVYFVDGAHGELKIGLLEPTDGDENYMAILDRGTRDGRIRPRPWILRGLRESETAIRRILGKEAL